MSGTSISPTSGSKGSYYSNLSHIAETVIQLAIRAIFVVGSVLATAAAFPVSMHSFAIPAVGFAAGILSGHFFAEPESVPKPYFVPGSPLICPTKMPEDMPIDAPRGLKNSTADNCAFNTAVQLIESDPELAQFFRTPLPEDLNEVIRFLNNYAPPDRVVQGFTNWQQFEGFLQNFNPEEGEEKSRFIAFKESYQTLQAFRDFFQSQEGNTEELRKALRLANGGLPERGQVDLPEILGMAFSVAPDFMKIRREIIHQLDATNLPAPLNGEQRTGETYEPFLNLPVQDTESLQKLEDLLEQYCLPSKDEPARNQGVDGGVYDYPKTSTVAFLETPNTLRIQFSRYKEVPEVRIPATPNFWNTWFPYFFPLRDTVIPRHSEKLNYPIEIPEGLSIRLKDGRVRQYQLVSYGLHKGSYGGGHYTAGRIKNGNYYRLNDSRVTHEKDSKADWEKELARSYVVFYTAIDPAPEQALPLDEE